MSETTAAQKIDRLLPELQIFQVELDKLSLVFRQRLSDIAAADDSKLSNDVTYWTLVAHSDAIKRLSLIVGQNFQVLETLGLLAVSRYVFEMLVWLRVIRHNSTFAFVYALKLIEGQLTHLRTHLKKIEMEINLFNELHVEEMTIFDESYRRIINTTPLDLQPQAIVEAKREVESYVDRKARREFCIAADQAKTNGYGFQAFLIEKQVLPGLKKEIEFVEHERYAFLNSLTVPAPLKYKQRCRWEDQPRAWKWDRQARSVGMLDQYEYIYSFTSSLLHATPASMHQATLQEHEMGIFLDYILVSIADVIELAQEPF